MSNRYIFIIIIFSPLMGVFLAWCFWCLFGSLRRGSCVPAFRRSVMAFDPLKGRRARAWRGSPSFPAVVVDLWIIPGSRRSAAFRLCSALFALLAVLIFADGFRRSGSAAVFIFRFASPMGPGPARTARRFFRRRFCGFAVLLFAGIFGRADGRTDGGRGLAIR